MSQNDKEKQDKRKRFEIVDDSSENDEEGKNGHNYLALGISLGMIFGISVGSVLEQPAIGISLGILLGTAFGVIMNRKQ